MYGGVTQDALAEAEIFRHEALHREQQLAAQVAQEQSEKDKLAKASPSSLCSQANLLCSTHLYVQELDAAKAAADSLQATQGSHDRAFNQKQAEVCRRAADYSNANPLQWLDSD